MEPGEFSGQIYGGANTKFDPEFFKQQSGYLDAIKPTLSDIFMEGFDISARTAAGSTFNLIKSGADLVSLENLVQPMEAYFFDEEGLKKLSEDEWKQSPYYREGLKYDKNLSVNLAKYISRIHDQQRIHQRDVASNGMLGSAVDLAANIAGTIIDPINLVPFAKVAGLGLSAVGRTGLSTFLSKKSFLSNLAEGAIDGAVGQGVQDALIGDFTLEDYTAQERATNIIIGGVAGGILSGTIYGIGKAIGVKSKDKVAADPEQNIADTLDTLSPIEKETYLQKSNLAISQIITEQPIDTSSIKLNNEGAVLIPETNQMVPIILPQNIRVGSIGDISVKYDIYELDDIIASNVLDGTNYVKNPNYDQRLQKRDLSDTSSFNKINNIADNLDPYQLVFSSTAETGAPILNYDKMVESGNARVLALQRFYARNPVKDSNRYVKYLQDLGLNENMSKKINTFEKPVLVRRRTTPLDEETLNKYLVYSNESQVGSKSAIEESVNYSDLITDDILNSYTGDSWQRLDNAPAYRKFVNQFPIERHKEFYSSDNRPSQRGLRILEESMLYKAYKDKDLVGALFESLDSDFKMVRNTLSEISPKIIKINKLISEGEVDAISDISHNLVKAFNIMKGAKDRNLTLEKILEAGDLYGYIDKRTETFIRSLFKDELSVKGFLSEKQMTSMLSELLDRLSTIKTNRDNLFDMPPAPDTQVLDIFADIRSNMVKDKTSVYRYLNIKDEKPDREILNSDLNRIFRSNKDGVYSDKMLADYKETLDLETRIGITKIEAELSQINAIESELIKFDECNNKI